MLTEWYPAEDRDRFISGLTSFDSQFTQDAGKAFSEASEAEQVELLHRLDAVAYPEIETMSDEERQAHFAQRAEDGPPFFALMKELTVSGYYTSEVGATQELHVNPMGTYRGDVPYSEIGKAWA